MTFKSFQPVLQKLIEQNGWSITQRESCSNDLWFLEIWTITSQWSPQGLRCYIVYEYDEHFQWAALAEQRPIDHYTTHWETRLYLKRGWERDIPTFLSVLEHLRDRHNGKQNPVNKPQ